MARCVGGEIMLTSSPKNGQKLHQEASEAAEAHWRRSGSGRLLNKKLILLSFLLAGFFYFLMNILYLYFLSFLFANMKPKPHLLSYLFLACAT